MNKSKESEIRKNLIDAINTSGIPKKQIAERVGISNTTLSDYIHRGTFPNLVTFTLLCEVLDVSADEILGLKKF